MYYLMHMVMILLVLLVYLCTSLPDADGHDEHGEDRGPGLVPFLHRKNYAW